MKKSKLRIDIHKPRQKRFTKMSAECPICGAEVEPEWDVERGEIIDCGDCGTELEVADTQPLELIEAPELEEDWGE